MTSDFKGVNCNIFLKKISSLFLLVVELRGEAKKKKKKEEEEEERERRRTPKFDYCRNC